MDKTIKRGDIYYADLNPVVGSEQGGDVYKRQIKTRDAVKGTIKTIDKAAVASERMKSAYSKIKSKAEQGYYADENSATEYAADKVSAASERITDEGVHQFNKQGQKGVKTTKDNVVKAKDKISEFKQKRAAKAAEQRMSGNSVQHARNRKKC